MRIIRHGSHIINVDHFVSARLSIGNKPKDGLIISLSSGDEVEIWANGFDIKIFLEDFIAALMNEKIEVVDIQAIVESKTDVKPMPKAL